jgi:hypothetical protein
MDLSLPALKARVLGVSPVITRLAATAIGLVLVVWAGLGASRAGDAKRAELRQADSVLATFADWRRRYRPVVAAESIAWGRTKLEVERLGVVGDERLALTRSVTQAAEAAGLTDVRVRIQSPDTTGSAERLSTEGVLRRAAPFGLSVEGRGSLQAIVAFLGELPPSVAPTDLVLVRQDGRARHRLTLAVYEIELPNGSPTVWTPQERGDTRRVGVNRAGG